MTEINTPQLPQMNDIWKDTLSWHPNPEQQEKFQQLYAGILAGNQQLNLTRITTPLEFWEKHLWDSLVVLKNLSLTSLKGIDIGSGAGFPGIPLAIILPEIHISLLDSTHKKVNFLKDLLTQINIKNAHPLNGRVEKIGQQKYYRQTYDLALTRAVGGASVCAEYALPLLKIGGQAVLYRGLWSKEETANLQPVVEQLGGTIESVESFFTPISNSHRHCIYLRKIKATPAQFPRAVGIPKKQPL